MARIAGEYVRNTMAVIRGARVLGQYQALDEREAFAIEYWALEEAKLRRQPPAKAFAGKIAYITGAAGAIGRAVAAQILAQDGCVMLTDIAHGATGGGAAKSVPTLPSGSGARLRRRCRRRGRYRRLFRGLCRGFWRCRYTGGQCWHCLRRADHGNLARTLAGQLPCLVGGVFPDVTRSLQGHEGHGGGDRLRRVENALAASAETAAYSSAKAAELHLARCLAVEGAPFGIRVNVVNPDAVLQGSTIWSGEWRAQRAAAYNLHVDELDEFYRKRSLLKRSVLAEDVADAVVFLA